MTSVGGRPLTRQELSGIEQRCGVKFPADYIAFAERWSGLAWSEQVVYDLCGEEAPVVFFYGASEKPHLQLERAIVNYRDRLPPGWIPIADEGGGNQICLCVADSRVGLWNHDSEDDNDDHAP